MWLFKEPNFQRNLNTSIKKDERNRRVRNNVSSKQQKQVGKSILFSLLMEAILSSERRILQEAHGATSQKTTFFIVTAVKISNLT
jgi:hypothetical protein